MTYRSQRMRSGSPPGKLKNEARELLCFPPPPKMEETPRPRGDRERERERDLDRLRRSMEYFFRPSCERRETTETASLSQKPIFDKLSVGPWWNRWVLFRLSS